MTVMRDAAKLHFMSGFFEELRRRKVYRVAAAYIIAAGFIIQIASAIFPAWELPNWTFRFLVTLLLIGFPTALILALAQRSPPLPNTEALVPEILSLPLHPYLTREAVKYTIDAIRDFF